LTGGRGRQNVTERNKTSQKLKEFKEKMPAGAYFFLDAAKAFAAKKIKNPACPVLL